MNIFVLSGKMMKFNIIEIAELIFDNLNNNKEGLKSQCLKSKDAIGDFCFPGKKSSRFNLRNLRFRETVWR